MLIIPLSMRKSFVRMSVKIPEKQTAVIIDPLILT